MSNTNAAVNTTEGGDVLKSFQLSSQSISSKSDEAYGKAIAEKILSTIASNSPASYYFNRNTRIRRNRLIASGRMNVQALFGDRLDFNGKPNYINLDWSCIKLGNRIISGLVGRWMARSEKIQVTATDPLSLNDKKEEYEQIEFIIENRKKLMELEQQSGVKMIPEEEGLPADHEQLNLWVTQMQKLPEEICFEMGCNDVLRANGFYGSNKEVLCTDSAVTGFVGTYTWMDESGIIHVEQVKPENAIYSYSERPDFSDTTYRGRIVSMKISEMRKKYGREFGGKLSEQELFEIAATAKEYAVPDKLTWIDQWVFTYIRPYDEWNVDVLEFELKTVDKDPLTIVTTKKNKSTIIKKGRPEKKDDNEEVIEDTNWNIYRGVVIREGSKVLEWGLKKNMIRPQDPKEIGNCEFSYSFYMYQSFDMTNVAVPEKIEEPLYQMILTRLKIQQLVATAAPPGSAINIDALQELDLGLAKVTTAWEAKKIADQTGTLYYRGRDAEGTPIPIPITERPNTGFLGQIQGYIQIYAAHYQVLKDELGEDPNLMSAALQPRVAAGNVQESAQQSEFATDYMYRAVIEVLKDTAKKISCLLHKSVMYGATAYRAILNEEDIRGRLFTTEISLLPDAIEIQKFEAMLQTAIASNPDLIMFLDPFRLMRIAKEDVKLAEVMFRQSQRTMIKHQQQTAQQNQEQTIQGQIQAAQMAEQEKRATKELEGEVDIRKAQITSDGNNKTALITGALAMYQKQQELGVRIPAEIAPLINGVLQSVGLSTAIQDEQKKMEAQEQMQQAVMEQQQMQQQQQASQEQQQLVA